MVQEINPIDRDKRPAESGAPALNPDIVRAADSESLPQSGSEQEEWRREFPYPWEEDDIVTRRDTLRFLLAGSGALCLATGALAILGNLPVGPGVQSRAIARVGELAENQWKVFNFPDQYTQGILIHLPGKGLVAYSDVCTHLSCALIYQGNGTLHCPCHEGLFDAASGNVLAGPPTRPLPLIQLAVKNGTIYAVRQVSR
jgi:nitrite reductase/ring-hydroxylating ferredoxin subunit